jgi:SAM-dependent methyltransferase
MRTEDMNFAVFSAPATVQFYANYSGLQTAEAYAFDKYITPGLSILDIGVGCGRTTPFLAATATHYIGIDYVREMIDICAARFPQHTFYCADATNLSMFEEARFNVVVFSFNGIDAIPTRRSRRQCIAEAYRVLAPGGLFIFSSHNARMLLNLPNFEAIAPMQLILRVGRSLVKSLPFVFRALHSWAFWAGCGYYVDPAHGGIRGYCATPKSVVRDLRLAGFEPVEVIGNLRLRRAPRFCTHWYYYVAAKPITNSYRPRAATTTT